MINIFFPLAFEILLKIRSNLALFWLSKRYLDQLCNVFAQQFWKQYPNLKKKILIDSALLIVSFGKQKRCRSWVNWSDYDQQTYFTCDLKKSLTPLYFRVCAFFPTWTTTLISFCFRNTFLGLGHGSFGISRVAFYKLSWFFSTLKVCS